MAEAAREDDYNKGITSKIQIPFFDPSCNKISARAWLAYVELARDSAGMKTSNDAGTEPKM